MKWSATAALQQAEYACSKETLSFRGCTFAYTEYELFISKILLKRPHSQHHFRLEHANTSRFCVSVSATLVVSHHNIQHDVASHIITYHHIKIHNIARQHDSSWDGPHNMTTHHASPQVNITISSQYITIHYWHY